MKRRRSYAGVGASHDVPTEILRIQRVIGNLLGSAGFVLRSGGANGSDTAFEEGCDSVNGDKEIFLPWSGFNGNPSTFTYATSDAYEIAPRACPHWDHLSPVQKKFHARNVHQVLGRSCADPVEAVFCYTPNGRAVGGTATAINLARLYRVPVYNLGTDAGFVFAKVLALYNSAMSHVDEKTKKTR